MVRRLQSLDILRGLTVIGMIVVNAAAGLQRFPVPSSLLHAQWIGLTLADLVFPAFIFIVGVSIAVSMRETTLDRAVASRIAVRSLRLIAIGLLLTNLYWLADPAAHVFRIGGVLQRIGLVFAVVAPLHLVLTTRGLGLCALAILVGYSLLCVAPIPGGMEVDLLRPGANLIAWADRAVLGSHIYVRGEYGYDPEGILSTLPAIAQGCLGAIAGRWLVQSAAVARFAIAGMLLVVAGALASLIVPLSKDLWSASFVLITSGLTLALLGLLHALVDVRGRRVPLQALLTAFGVNALAAYVVHYVAAGVLGWRSVDVLYAAAADLMPPPLALLLPIVLFVGAIGWGMLALQRRGWIIRL